jgi:hypothetical protein
MTSPPPPEEGIDCFPYVDCTGAFSLLSFSGVSSGQTDPEKMPFQLFFATDGYVYLAVLEYSHVDESLEPFWVWVFKSTEAVACDDVREAGSSGLEVSFSYLCNDMAAGWEVTETSGECDITEGPWFDFTSATITGRIFHSRFSCCEAEPDPCNPPPEGACGEGTPGTVECLGCDPDSLAPANLSIQIVFDLLLGAPACTELYGTYIVPYFDCLAFEARYYQEFEFDPPVSLTSGTCYKISISSRLSRSGVDPFRQTIAYTIIRFFYTDNPSQGQQFTGGQIALCPEIDDLEALFSGAGDGVCSIKLLVSAA